MARITTAIRERVESILSSGVDAVNADSVSTDSLGIKIPKGASAAEIENIINNSPSGSTFRFPDYECVTDETIDLTTRHITLDGGGPFGGFTLKAADGTGAINLIQADGEIIIKNMEIGGNAANRPQSGGQDNNCGIFIGTNDSVNRVGFYNNYVHDTPYSNVRVKGFGQIDQVEAIGNWLIGTEYGGGETSDNFSTTGDVLNVNLVGGYYWDCQTDGIEISGISDKAQIIGANCHNNQRRGIYTHGLDSSARANVSNATVTGAGEIGIKQARKVVGSVIEHSGTGAAVQTRQGGYYAGNVSDGNLQPSPNTTFLGNTANGIFNFASDISGTTFIGNTVENTLRLQNDCLAAMNEVNGSIDLAGADDNLLENYGSYSLNTSSATRPRYYGTIGGGPLGGVNVANVTGAEAGDKALTTGGSAAPADVIAVFDGADWIYPTRGGGVTPS